MNIEELKLILGALEGVTSGAVNVAIAYLLLNFLAPVLKYSIVVFGGYKIVRAVTDRFIVEKKSAEE